MRLACYPSAAAFTTGSLMSKVARLIAFLAGLCLAPGVVAHSAATPAPTAAERAFAADLEKHPEIKDYFEALTRDKGS